MDSAPDPESTMKDKLVFYVQQLENLQPEDDFVEILENLIALLISANHRDVQQLASELDLSRLFNQFNTLPDAKFCDEMIRVFGMFLEALPLEDIFTKYGENILEGLQTKNLSIVELWLKKVVKPFFTNEGLVRQLNPSYRHSTIKPVLRTVIRLLVCPDTSVAKATHDICVAAAKMFREEFFSPIVMEEFRDIQEWPFPNPKDQDQFLIRFYEICIDIACINQLLLGMINQNDFLEEMIEDFKKKLDNDPLVAVNIIKLITDLASQPHGLEFLRVSTTIFQYIAKKIAEIDEEDMFGSLVLPGYINCFIKVAQTDLTILQEYPDVLDKLVGYCQTGRGGNQELQLLAIESVAFLCRQCQGKLFLASRMQIFLDTIIMMINSGKNDLKSRAITALNEIMEIQGADPGNKATDLTEVWYKYLDSCDCGLDRFMKFIREPFLDVRIPALNFIHVLATTLWGQKLLSLKEGFLDYLLDRSTENCKEGREAKFAIVRELAMSPFFRVSFPPEAQLRIRAYFKDGPIHKDVNVAFENS